MIKLVACDIDGTLLPLGQRDLSPETVDMIRRVMDSGIIFCPCSGRQLASLKRLFAPVAERCAFLCDCGADGWLAGKRITSTPLPRDIANEIIGDIIAHPRCEVIVSGMDGNLYICTKPWHDGEAEPGLHKTDMIPFTAPEDIPTTILRVSAYCQDSGIVMDPYFGQKWRPRGVNVAVGSPAWLDFSLSDKGLGLRAMCQALGIGLEDVAAFGDSYNDLPMLHTAGQPWLMDIARPELKAQFPGRICRSVGEVLDAYLAQQTDLL